MDITGYNINITSNDTLLINTTVNVTQYTYNVNQTGVYTVSVIATIGGLEGVIDTVVVYVHEGIVIHCLYSIYPFIIPVVVSQLHDSSTVYTTSSGTSSVYTVTNDVLLSLLYSDTIQYYNTGHIPIINY